jgi:hypothetical protein
MYPALHVPLHTLPTRLLVPQLKLPLPRKGEPEHTATATGRNPAVLFLNTYFRPRCAESAQASACIEGGQVLSSGICTYYSLKPMLASHRTKHR